MNNKYDNMVKIKTDFGYIEIATENYHEGDKMYFTFNEAIKLEFPDNWRLPTYKEIEAIKAALIFENGKMFIEDIKGREKVEIPLSGQETNNDGTYGYYWSSTISYDSAYRLCVYKGNCSINKSTHIGGLSIRCVRTVAL